MSAIVNRGLPLKAYVFRNYRLMPGVRSHYLGDCKHKMWQAIRASSAAPGYFQEFVLGKDLHQVQHGAVKNHKMPCASRVDESKIVYISWQKTWWKPKKNQTNSNISLIFIQLYSKDNLSFY